MICYLKSDAEEQKNSTVSTTSFGFAIRPKGKGLVKIPAGFREGSKLAEHSRNPHRKKREIGHRH
jgi:hypothetical protein